MTHFFSEAVEMYPGNLEPNIAGHWFGWTHIKTFYTVSSNLIWANMPQNFQDPLEKWKSIDKSTNTAELTHCTSNEAGALGLINLYSSFWLRQKKHIAAPLFAEEGTKF